jgi:MFS family permease
MDTKVETSSATVEAVPGADARDNKAASAPPSGAGLLRNHNFSMFWAGQTFDAFGDSAALILIPLLVLEATGSVAQMGLVTAVMGVSNLISSIISGTIADRFNRRKIMISCDIARAMLYPLIPACWWLSGQSIWPLYIVAAIASYLTTFFMITYTTAVPNIVDQSQISEANGRLQATVALAYIAGPMMAGFASKHFSPNNAVFMVSLAYAISAALMSFVRLRKSSAVESGDSAEGKTSRLDTYLAGIRFLLRHPVLRPVTLLLAAFLVISGATINLTIYRLRHDLGRSDDTVGIVFGLASFGALIGGALAPLLRRKRGFGFSFLGSAMLLGAATALIGVMPSVSLIALMAGLYGFGNTVRSVSSVSLRQQVTPDYLLGRVSSAFWAMLTVLSPLGTAGATSLAEWVGASTMLVITGIMCILVAVIGLFTRAQMRKPETAYTPEQLDAGGLAVGS